jgi:hypothetical protein
MNSSVETSPVTTPLTSPVTTPEVDSELTTTPINSRISSIFMEWSKKISNVSLNTNRNTEYEEFLDGYQMKL